MTQEDQMKLLAFLLKHDPEATVKDYIREAKEFELRQITREHREEKKEIISSETKIKGR